MEKSTRKPSIPCMSVHFIEVSALWCVRLREIPLYKYFVIQRRSTILKKAELNGQAISKITVREQQEKRDLRQDQGVCVKLSLGNITEDVANNEEYSLWTKLVW